MADKRVCLITGAHKGMGLEAARQLGKKGLHVIPSARDSEQSEAAVARLKSDGVSAEPLTIDTTNEVSVRTAARAVHERHGKLDVLINNAGVSLEFDTGITPETLGIEQIRATYETNVFGTFRMIQAFTPLLADGDGPRIVNIASTMGSLAALSDPESPYYEMNVPAYNSSKSAVNGLTVAYAKALKSKGISVTSICPGWVRTDIGTKNAFKSVEEGVMITVQVATMDNPPSGAFVDIDGPVPW
ncbi:SDR family oxidoreductase [Roseobacter weihaiensis]|uniref:SDR family oxidoreductase n=1 Tax=Roseobacter weihaiensis TaxID=2763262 RepID=UPI001D0B1445|nr:SDR family oxidoreductase [Roseobacter sp. H9]